MMTPLIISCPENGLKPCSRLPRLAPLGIDRALKSVEALVKADSKGGERVSWDSLLLVLLDVYIELQPRRSWSLSQPAGSSDTAGQRASYQLDLSVANQNPAQTPTFTEAYDARSEYALSCVLGTNGEGNASWQYHSVGPILGTLLQFLCLSAASPAKRCCGAGRKPVCSMSGPTAQASAPATWPSTCWSNS